MKTKSKWEVNLVKDSYNLREKLGTCSNWNAVITKFRQNHTSLVFRKDKNKGKAIIRAEISQGKGRNKLWGVVGNEYCRQET